MSFKNLGERVLVALVFGPVVLAASWFGGWWFFALMLIIAGMAGFEFQNILRAKKAQPAVWINLALIPVVFMAVYTGEFAWLVPAIAGWGILVHLLVLFDRERSPVADMGANSLYLVYIVILYAFMLALRQLPVYLGLPYRWGGEWVILMLAATWLCDTFAYFIGTRFGKHKPVPKVSPNKSTEGAVGGIVGAVLTALVCQATFATSLSSMQAVVVGLIIGVFGQLSDLVESMYKRDAGVKDASGILPGHGGILDRFDSELLAVPLVVFYLYVAMS